MSTEKINAILSEHEHMLGGPPPRLCACGFWRDLNQKETFFDVHREHLAEVIVAEMARIYPAVEITTVGGQSTCKVSLGGVPLFSGSSAEGTILRTQPPIMDTTSTDIVKTIIAEHYGKDGWKDRQGDLWTLGADGRLHSPGTAPFSSDYVEKKWGPLKRVTHE